MVMMVLMKLSLVNNSSLHQILIMLTTALQQKCTGLSCEFINIRYNFSGRTCLLK